MPKISLISKNVSNKSSLEFNFLQKTQWVLISISLRSGTKGLEKLICLKYYCVLKLESRCNLGLNTAKHVEDIKKKVSNKSSSEFNFLQKTQRAHMSVSPRSGLLFIYFITFHPEDG